MRLTKGFTLIELLIVIGILAVLATITVLVLNPAELFRQSRDSQRLSDLKTLRTAIDLALLIDPSLDMDSEGPLNCPNGFGASVAGAISTFSGARQALASEFSTRVNGSGWVPINFSGLTGLGGSPLARLPADPSNIGGAGGFNYQYACSNSAKTFELTANLESARYISGTENKEINTFDGGTTDTIYEVGSEPGLDL